MIASVIQDALQQVLTIMNSKTEQEKLAVSDGTRKASHNRLVRPWAGIKRRNCNSSTTGTIVSDSAGYLPYSITV